MGMPIVRKLRILACLVSRDGTLGSDGEVDPAVAMRTLADEACVVPPGSYQRVVDCTPVNLQAEINGLHRLPTTDVRTGRFRVHDVRSHLAVLTRLSKEGVHLVEVLCSRS